MHKKDFRNIYTCGNRQKGEEAAFDERIFWNLKYDSEIRKYKTIQFQISAIYKENDTIPWQDEGMK